MIAGSLDSGLPVVELAVWCPALRARAAISFLVDTSAAISVVVADDLGLIAYQDLPLDDLAIIHVSDALVASGLEVRTLLTARHDNGSYHLEETVLLVTGSDDIRSRLGRDILNRWLMLYDPPGGQLLFEPASV